MKKKQLQAAIVILLIMESLSKTIIPVRLELDNLGYDAYWFMVVYLIAAYIRLYGIPFLEQEEGKGNRALLCYIGACFGMYLLTMLIRRAYLFTGQFENFIESPYGYNHLLTISAAAALFYVFKNWEFGEGMNFICKIAPCSFGVYLLHEQINIRYKWPFWLGADRCDTVLSLLGHWLAAILIVMAIGLAVDYVRCLLFKGVGKLLAGGRLDLALRRVDDMVNGVAD